MHARWLDLNFHDDNYDENWDLLNLKFFFCKWYSIVEANNEQKIVSDSKSKQWTEKWCFCCLLWLAWWWWSLMFMFIYCEVVNFYWLISFIFCMIFFLLQLLFLHSIFTLLSYSIFYSFCKIVLYDFIKYYDSSEYKADSWFNVQWADHITSEDKKERRSLKYFVILVSLIQKCTHLSFAHFICCWFCCLWFNHFVCCWWSFLHIFHHLYYAHLHEEFIFFSSAS